MEKNRNYENFGEYILNYANFHNAIQDKQKIRIKKNTASCCSLVEMFGALTENNEESKELNKNFKIISRGNMVREVVEGKGQFKGVDIEICDALASDKDSKLELEWENF